MGQRGQIKPDITKNQAIDLIWGASGLTTAICDYLYFHYGLKYDHGFIWIKISLTTAFRANLTPSKFPSDRKL